MAAVAPLSAPFAVNSPGQPHEARRVLLWSIGFFLANLLIKGIFLGSQPVAGDEPFTLYWAQQPLGNIWELAKHENNPPLHFIVAHYWLAVFGWSEWAFRASSLLFSALAAMALYRAGRRHFGQVAGVMAGLLATLSTEHILYSHELRCYPMLGLLTIWLVDRFLRLRTEATRWQHYGLLALLNALLIYTHFLGIWVLLAQMLLWPALGNWRQVWWRIALTFLAVGLLYAPNVYVVLLRVASVKSGGTWVLPPEWTQLYGHINIFLNGKWGTVGLGLGLVAALGMAALGSGVAGRLAAANGRRQVLTVFAVFGIIYGGIYLQSLLFAPAFIPRYLYFSSLPLFLGMGGLLSIVAERSWQAAICIGVTLLGMLPGLYLNPSNDGDGPAMAAHIAAVRQPDAPVLICPGYYDKTYAFHADRSAFQDYGHFRERLAAGGAYSIFSIHDLPPGLVSGSRQVVYVDANADAFAPDNGILDSLGKVFPPGAFQQFNSKTKVWVFQR